MEKMMSKALTLEELEVHSRVELLPDRIEMHRPKRVRKKIRKRIGNVTCEGGDNSTVTCNRIR